MGLAEPGPGSLVFHKKLSGVHLTGMVVSELMPPLPESERHAQKRAGRPQGQENDAPSDRRRGKKSDESNQVQSKGQTGKDDPNWQQKKINEAYNEKKNTLDIEDEEDIEKGREKKKPGKETDASELDKPPLETYEEERQQERGIAHESSERKPERHIPL